MSPPASGTYLDRILAAHRARIRSDPRDLAALAATAEGRAACRGFGAALRQPGLSVIAEIKRRSPSRGELAPSVDPARQAGAYAAGGADAMSVLTDEEFFGGSPRDLTEARAAVTLPVLRKDFTVGRADVLDARIMDADAVLLIVAALDDRELTELHGVATDLGLDVLVEVHDEVELDRALAAGATIVGVNQRDLVTFEVDGERAERLAARIPTDVVRVAESGVAGPDQAQRLHRAGYDAVLVGELLMGAADPGAVIEALRTGDPIPEAREPLH